MLLLLLAPALEAQYTLQYSTNGSVISVVSYTGTPVAVVLPNFVTAVGDGAFSYCSSLSSVALPNSVTCIGDFSFELCTQLAQVTMSTSVTNIGSDAFSYCTSLANAPIPAGVTTIGQAAFSYCALTNVYLPASVTALGFEAFGWCEGLTNLAVDAQNPAYSGLNGVLFDKAQATLIQYPIGSSAATYAVPGSVRTIQAGAFYDAGSLTGVIIPPGVTSIGSGAFEGSGVTNLAIPGTVNTIGQEAFAFCSSLSNISIPGSVTALGEYLFYECGNLQGVLFTGNAPAAETTVFQGAPATAYYFPGTSGWQGFASSTGAPVVLWNPTLQPMPGRPFTVGVNGTPNIPIVLEATTNLAGPWTVLESGALTNGAVQYQDGAAATLPSRYYSVGFP
jgi:hypothetical protein